MLRLGTPVKANGKRAIYVGENPDFYRCSDSGKHLVIFENEEEVCEVNKVVKTTFKPKKSKDGFPTWEHGFMHGMMNLIKFIP